MLIARTDPDVPKHQGITYFAIDMHQPGIEVRPLREMTGRAMFNEVFLSDARVADDAIIGERNNGWAVANTTLPFERAGLGCRRPATPRPVPRSPARSPVTSRASRRLRRRAQRGVGGGAAIPAAPAGC